MQERKCASASLMDKAQVNNLESASASLMDKAQVNILKSISLAFCSKSNELSAREQSCSASHLS